MTAIQECAGRLIDIIGKMLTADVATGETVTAVLVELRAFEVAETVRCAALATAAGDKEVAALILGRVPPAREAGR